MKYVMTFTESGRDILLDDDTTVESVSAECRSAALAFMAGGSGWDKLDLALWLTGPYARAVRHGGRGERVTALHGAPEVEETTLGGLVANVRRELLAALEDAVARDGALDFADVVVQRGHVRKALDTDGIGVWIPVDLPRMRLVDRVRALFAADYLNAPDAYTELFVCQRCDVVEFDASSKRLRLCAAHKRNSGIVFREGEDAAALSDGTSGV